MARFQRTLADGRIGRIVRYMCNFNQLVTMANKTAKLTREQAYREILERAGIRFEDCNVLAFVFEQERRPELFHFGLMLHEPRPIYYLFDCWDKYANVIVPKDENNAAVIISIAEKDGGKKTTPNLR